MNVTAVSAPGVPPRVRQLAAEANMQSVFAEVLAAAGETGFASAKPGARPEDVAPSDIATAWQDWLAATGAARYQTLEQPQQTFENYQALLIHAAQQNAYAAPQAFLQQLSSSDLATLQRVNSLAEPIDLAGLSHEGALNLLLPPPAQVDRNGDGLTQTGAGYTVRFPDSRTPLAVVQAWNETTAGLPAGERMTRELQMKADVLLANLRVDSAGRVTQIPVGAKEFVDPQAAANYSYQKKAQQALASVEHFRQQTPPEQYARDKSFWTAWQQALEKFGAV